MRHRVPDISKIRNLIGYSPRVKLDEMLKSIIESKGTEAQRHRGTKLKQPKKLQVWAFIFP